MKSLSNTGMCLNMANSPLRSCFCSFPEEFLNMCNIGLLHALKLSSILLLPMAAWH